ncbi:FecR family protein [Dyadobacter subterraneus]|uniref:FecR family protein n=1 Tax=Dyadobacter subterraneus TaxID=2773304 RepID=A0ABR9WEU9_9BACT|nr:FecR family protein [Dyadobacter subterraneus]MBE9464025.1 FecR family protein [Dyadobacter subterraneus]
MNPNIPSSQILKKYLSNLCSSEERAMVDAWYQKLNLDSGEAFSVSDESELYQRIQSQIHKAESSSSEKARFTFRIWKFIKAAAAVIFLSFGLFYFFQFHSKNRTAIKTNADSSLVTFQNNQKKIIRYTLPDHSIVWLRPGANLVHPKEFKHKKNREIRFSGEGFFDIVHDKKHPFIVNCGSVKTQVLGTTFSVRANTEESTFQVSVVTGSVSVSTPKGKNNMETVVLQPKEQAIYEKASQNVTVNHLKNAASNQENWQSVSLAFDETPMSEVANRLQMTFKIKIEFANLNIKKCRLKVDFNNQRLPEILDMIDILLGTTYEIDGSRIVLKGDGCNG